MATKNKGTEDVQAQEANATEYSKSDKYNELVDQETGEVKKGQPGATGGESASDRPTLTEEEAREVNGYAGFENVEEQRAADPNKTSESGDYDTLVKKG